jgi:hypothetical protein
MIGFILGAAVPVILGLREVTDFNAFRVAIAPRLPPCGNDLVEGWAMVIAGGPICGLIGANLISAIVTKFR